MVAKIKSSNLMHRQQQGNIQPSRIVVAFMSFLAELEWRGLLHQTAGPQLSEYLSTPGRVGYCGFDPTADSLTVGNFIAIKLLMHWQRAGHTPIALMGGGTGLIGDPSGKDSERQLLDADQVRNNIASQRLALDRLLDFDPKRPNAAILLNNQDWLGSLGYIEMLRDVGKYFSVNVMLQRDSVRERLQQREQGISYTEFSYVLLQAYDFLHLRQTHNCTVQLAGSDQYGNIVAGMDLIRRKLPEGQNDSYAVTNKLLVRADGQKIGKSAGNAVWLNPDRTSPFKFYQFWLNTDDADIIRFLYWLTFMPREEIQALTAAHEQAPHQRTAHRALAQHLTDLVHGESARNGAEQAASTLFGRNDPRTLDAQTLREVFADIPHSEHSRDPLAGGIDSVTLLIQTPLAQSRREAREFLNNGAITLNGERITPDHQITSDDLLHGDTLLLRRGKKHWHAMVWK
jgi:tyrosyl-tRNA synthetase